MLWIATLLSEIFFGYELAVLLSPRKLDKSALIGFAAPFGIALSAFLFFYCGFFLGFNKLHIIVHTACLFVVAVTLFLRRIQRKKKKKAFDLPSKNVILFGVISFMTAVFVSWPMYFRNDNSIHETFTGDFHEELALMDSFHRGVNSGIVNIFKIRHPACYKCVARTRWLTALHSAILRSGWASLRWSFTAPSILFVFSIFYNLCLLVYQYTQSIVLAIASIPLFLFAGGSGYLQLLVDRAARSNKRLDFVFMDGEKVTEWSHPIYHYLFAFRPSQLALALSTTLLCLLTYPNGITPRSAGFCGIILGLLIAIQHQTFFSAVVFLMGFALFKLFHFNAKKIFVFVIGFLCIALPQMLMFFPRKTNGPLFKKHLFYEDKTKTPQPFPGVTVWYQNLGVFSVVVFVVFWFFMDWELANLYLPALIVFVIGNNWTFQGYNRQNITFFYPFWMVPAIVTFLRLSQKIEDKFSDEQLRGVIRGMYFVFYVHSIASGSVGFIRLYSSTSFVFTKGAEETAQWIINKTPRKAIFINSGSEYSPVYALAGRVSLVTKYKTCNYLSFNDTEYRDLQEVFLKDLDNTTILPKVRYLVNNKLDDFDSYLPPINSTMWKEVYSHSDFTIFERQLPQ